MAYLHHDNAQNPAVVLGAGEVPDSLPDRYGRDGVEKAKAAARLLFLDALIAEAA